jgi:hypothetical protein
MSHFVVKDGVRFVTFCAEPPDACELCGRVEELRPYGPGGTRVCFNCMKLDEEGAKRRFAQIMLGEGGEQ